MSIENLEKKLNGELPITRGELLELVSSWGRERIYQTNGKSMEVKECYDLSKLDVSQITNMSEIFRGSLFNGDISSWDTSNATNMYRMFYGVSKFNSPLPWDTSSVTNMCGMLWCATNFNQALNFDTSMVTSLSFTFAGAKNFNQDLNFDTSKVTSTYGMLYEAKSFNRPLNFDMSRVVNDVYMLSLATSFLYRYNNGEDIGNPKEWLTKNREKMITLSISKEEKDELDSFFDEIEDSLKVIDNIERTKQGL